MTGGAGSDALSLDSTVSGLLDAGATAAQIADDVMEVEGVAAARLRAGLVKTEPPILELEVVYGAEATRVYDLAQHPDGSLHWAGAHDA